MEMRVKRRFRLFAVLLLLSLTGLIGGCAGRDKSIPESDRGPHVSTAPAPLDKAKLAAVVDELSQIKGSGPWQQYSRLMLSFPNGKAFVFQCAGSEMLIEFFHNNQVRSEAFIIPKAVLMTKDLPTTDGPPSHVVERAGLEGQLALFVLQQAFPAGPSAVQMLKHAVVVENVQEHQLRFLAGLVKLRPPWQAEVDAKPSGQGRIDFVIAMVNPNKPNGVASLKGTWDNRKIARMPSDSERVSGWDVSFHGARSLSTGKLNPTIGDAATFATIGDIRRVARSAQ